MHSPNKTLLRCPWGAGACGMCCGGSLRGADRGRRVGHGRATAGGGGQGGGWEEGLLHSRQWAGAFGGALAGGGQAHRARVLAWGPRCTGGVGGPISEKARGKVPAVEPLPPEIDKELAQHLQWEEYAAEEAQRGQDTATLVVVREATGLLMWGQLEGLGRPS